MTRSFRCAASPGALLAVLVAGSARAGEAAIVADLHLDTPSQLADRGLPLDAPAGLEAGLVALRAGGVGLATMALWAGKAGVDHPARVERLFARLEAEDARLDAVRVVRTPAEARAAVAAGRIGRLGALQGAAGRGADWEAALAAADLRGLRMVGLVWSRSNRFAGSSGDGGGGLTDDGRRLLAAAQARGLLVDVSHASRPATLAACAAARAPLVASHSGAAAVFDHPRNLSDAEARCIAGTGGVIALNLHAAFLGGAQDLQAAVAHLEHLRALVGARHLAIGSDYDGWIQTPAGLPDAASRPRLIAALAARGWSAEELALLQGEAFLRAWEQAAAVR